jgi:hypothetical protein
MFRYYDLKQYCERYHLKDNTEYDYNYNDAVEFHNEHTALSKLIRESMIISCSGYYAGLCDGDDPKVTKKVAIPIWGNTLIWNLHAFTNKRRNWSKIIYQSTG